MDRCGSQQSLCPVSKAKPGDGHIPLSIPKTRSAPENEHTEGQYDIEKKRSYNMICTGQFSKSMWEHGLVVATTRSNRPIKNR